MSRTTTETALIPEVEVRPRMSLLRSEVIEDAVIVSEEGRHPNFIEANTSGITRNESSRRSIRRAYIRRVQSFTPYHRTYSIRPEQESE